MNNEEYDRRMEHVKLSKIKTKCIKKKDYRNILKYDVTSINDRERLIETMAYHNDGIRYYVIKRKSFQYAFL